MDEILVYILDYLDVRDLARLSKVGKSLREIVRHNLSNYILNNYGYIPNQIHLEAKNKTRDKDGIQRLKWLCNIDICVYQPEMVHKFYRNSKLKGKHHLVALDSLPALKRSQKYGCTLDQKMVFYTKSIGMLKYLTSQGIKITHDHILAFAITDRMDLAEWSISLGTKPILTTRNLNWLVESHLLSNNRIDGFIWYLEQCETISEVHIHKLCKLSIGGRWLNLIEYLHNRYNIDVASNKLFHFSESDLIWLLDRNLIGLNDVITQDKVFDDPDTSKYLHEHYNIKISLNALINLLERFSAKSSVDSLTDISWIIDYKLVNADDLLDYPFIFKRLDLLRWIWNRYNSWPSTYDRSNDDRDEETLRYLTARNIPFPEDVADYALTHYSLKCLIYLSTLNLWPSREIIKKRSKYLSEDKKAWIKKNYWFITTF